MEKAAGVLVRFLDDVIDAPEVLWMAGLAMIDRATAEGREAKWSRFRYYPRGQLRRLRQDIAPALRLLRLAVALQEAMNERDRELTADLKRQAEEAGHKRRRAQTLPAERARLENARRRREERP